MLAVLDLMPSAAAGTVTEENGTTVITVSPSTVISVTAELETSESDVTGYQINFGNSHALLVLSNWVNSGANFPLAIDSTLNHATNDRFIAAIGFVGVATPPVKEIGTFQATAPAAEGDYRLTIDFTTGGETVDTVLSDAGGSAIPVTDFGDLIIRVQIPNDPPTISSIDDVTIDEDTMTGDLAFTVGDTETDAASLVVTASSDNQALIPDGNIVISGTGANRTVKVTPLGDQNGSALITLTVSDGVKTTEETFTVNVTPINDAPTISSIDDVTIDEDNMTGDLSFTLSDLETSVDSLIVSATSGNQTLIPDGNIVISGTGANRTVKVTPLPNQSGSALITLVVSDGDKSSEETFTVNVSSVNDAPTISALNDVTIDEDTMTGDLAFTVGDLETDVNSLVVTATSDNTALVPNGSIVISGTGTNRTVKVTPLPDQNGMALITLVVSDGDKTTEETFTLNITPVNDAPTISPIDDVTIDEDTMTGDLPFTVDDVETDAGSLVVSVSSDNQALVPDGNIVISGTGVNRTVKVTPLLDQNGSAVITLIISDGNKTAEETFTVNVTPINDAPSISAIDDVTIDEDTMTGDLAFTLDDLETDPASLLVSATSDNLVLIPNGSIVISGTGGNRTVKVTPLADQNGSAVITLTVSDGDMSTVETFTVNVTPINDAPTVTPVDDVTIDEDTMTGDIPFTIDDLESSPGVLIVSVTSDNQALVPDGNIVLGGIGASRTVKVTPLPNQSGSALITLVISDGDKSIEETFTVTVVPVNDPPTVSAIDDVTIDEDTMTGDLAFTIDDLETNADTLIVSANSDNLSLIPNENILISGTGANRTVKVTPLADQNGAAIITLVVSDGEKSTEETFTVNVTPINDQPSSIQLSGTSLDENSDAFEVGAITIQDADSGDTFTYDISDNRFEVINGVLKLNSGVLVDFEAESEISVTIRATDTGNLFVEDTFQLQVVNKNDVPEVNQTLPNITVDLGDPAQLIDISNVFSDQDIASMGDSLTISVGQNSNPSVVTASIIGGDLKLDISKMNVGTSQITLRATDTENEFVETSFFVTVTLNSSVSINISSLGDSGNVGDSRPVNLTPMVLNEWQNAIAGVWVTVGDETPTEPFDMTLQIEWSTQWYEAAEVIDFLGNSGMTDTAVDQGVATTDVTFVGIDLSGYSIGENVLIGKVALNVYMNDPIGVPMEGPGAYPTLVENIGFTLNAATLVVGDVELLTAPIPQVDLSPVIYDADDSGHVGLGDFAEFLRNYGRVPGELNPESYTFDYDRSGRVGITDFALLIQHYGRRKPSDRFVNMPGLTTPLNAASSFELIEAEPAFEMESTTESLADPPATSVSAWNAIIVLPADSTLENRSTEFTAADRKLPLLALRIDAEHPQAPSHADQFFQLYEQVANSECDLIETDSGEERTYHDALDQSLEILREEEFVY
ncbi:hypothetical protein C5Y96_23305 [Blastopirellula marina]|uniref:Cadherin domain-containing protein n=2 Tax=Pirellulales TaxID=2691354 RepID=A0A2S8F0R8_9BACT|nr:hypothetical protein C5Y96_23305 [Blastopirellula marina]RCS43423.1 hypothetical protein DTL36_23355 [Bremerella cremea]